MYTYIYIYIYIAMFVTVCGKCMLLLCRKMGITTYRKMCRTVREENKTITQTKTKTKTNCVSKSTSMPLRRNSPANGVSVVAPDN